MKIAGIILAGGRSSRFAGGSKEDALLNGRTLLSHVIERSAPQVDVIAISRAKDKAASVPGVATVADIYSGCGPLGGLHAGFVWAKSVAADHLATFACDTPLIPRDMVARLLQAMRRSGAPAAIASANGDRHPTLGLWSAALEPVVRRRLERGDRALLGLADEIAAATVEFADQSGTGFFNVNTREDLAALQALLAKTGES